MARAEPEEHVPCGRSQVTGNGKGQAKEIRTETDRHPGLLTR